jgi:succinate dehydrogenase / fumarate reductase membrane anchor subunit
MIDKSVISNPTTRYGHKGHGTRLFKLQRLTGMINLAALLFFIWLVISLAGAGREAMVATIGHPLVAILLAGLVVSVTLHMRIGILEVIEDYVDEDRKSRLSKLLNDGFCILIALVALGSIVKIVFWG